MKMLVERIIAPGGYNPIPEEMVMSHIRVTDDDLESRDNEITRMSMTAASEIEHAAQCALLNQVIRVTILDPITDQYLNLPIGPISSDTSATVEIDNYAFNDFTTVGHLRPMIVWGPSFLNLRPKAIVVEYVAGFGTDWAFVPFDLQQAVLDQTALHYDGRSPMDPRELQTSPHFARIAARYRGVSL